MHLSLVLTSEETAEEEGYSVVADVATGESCCGNGCTSLRPVWRSGSKDACSTGYPPRTYSRRNGTAPVVILTAFSSSGELVERCPRLPVRDCVSCSIPFHPWPTRVALS